MAEAVGVGVGAAEGLSNAILRFEKRVKLYYEGFLLGL